MSIIGEKAEWETAACAKVSLFTPTKDMKMNTKESNWYHTLMDTSSESDVAVLSKHKIAKFQQ